MIGTMHRLALLAKVSIPGRLFSTTRVSKVRLTRPARTDAKKPSEVSNASQTNKSQEQMSASARLPVGPIGVPTALDKMFLVWNGQYKSTDQVPKQLDGNVIHRVRSWARIRINIGFLFLAAGMAGVMVYSGKQAVKRGESLEQQNLDWHKKVNEEYRKQTGSQK